MPDGAISQGSRGIDVGAPRRSVVAMVTSAGILLFRRKGESSTATGLEVLIAHMGGPFWRGKDAGAWSIPKGEYDARVEAPLDAARREFEEELGVPAPAGQPIDLGEFAYSSGKILRVFAVDGTRFTVDEFDFGTFELEWPPRSGRLVAFPEVDRAEWMATDAAASRLVKGQRPALDALSRWLSSRA